MVNSSLDGWVNSCWPHSRPQGDKAAHLAIGTWNTCAPKQMHWLVNSHIMVISPTIHPSVPPSWAQPGCYEPIISWLHHVHTRLGWFRERARARKGWNLNNIFPGVIKFADFVALSLLNQLKVPSIVCFVHLSWCSPVSPNSLFILCENCALKDNKALSNLDSKMIASWN